MITVTVTYLCGHVEKMPVINRAIGDYVRMNSEHKLCPLCEYHMSMVWADESTSVGKDAR
jgi:uncharacterized protein (UPF0212 family)